MRHVGQFILRLLKEKRKSIRWLSRQACVSNSYLSQVTRGLLTPRPEIVRKLAPHLGVSARTIFEEAGWLEPEPVRGPEPGAEKCRAGESRGDGERLAELVDYQPGAVVSREIVTKSTGTVTLFAFDEGQGLSEHTAPFDALVYLLDGEAEIVISGKRHRLKQGEMIIMPANEPHALKALKRFKMLLIMIRS